MQRSLRRYGHVAKVRGEGADRRCRHVDCIVVVDSEAAPRSVRMGPEDAMARNKS